MEINSTIKKVNTQEYNTFLIDIKNKIKLSQQKAFSSVNQKMIMLYFNIGSVIEARQKEFVQLPVA